MELIGTAAQCKLSGFSGGTLAMNSTWKWAAFAFFAAAAPASNAQVPEPDAFHLGICIEGGPKIEDRHFEELKSLGATHVSLNPFGWMNAPDDPQVFLSKGRRGDSQGRWWGEGDEGIRHYALSAHRNGFMTLLRPHIWLRSTKDKKGGRGLWLGDVGFDTDEEWKTFFDSYTQLALHYGRIAEETGIEWYSVGAELTRASTEHPEQWRKIIASVREVYHGKLTYSANWWAEAEGITFWDSLDAIGVQAYYPLSDSDNPSVEEMVESWQKPLAALAGISRRFERPVVFTEIGYRSTADAASRPWEWRGEGPEAEEVQARCYRAAFQALEGFPEGRGLYWWKYHVDSIGEDSRRFSGSRRQFSWQGKIAEDTLRSGFARIAHREAVRMGVEGFQIQPADIENPNAK
jgi:hypothetical protein